MLRRESLSAVVLILALLVGSCGGQSAEDALVEGLAPLDAAHEQLRDFQRAVDAGMSYGDILSEWPRVSVAFQASMDEFERAALPEPDRCDADQWQAFLLLAHDGWEGFRDGVAMFVEGSIPEELVPVGYSLGENSMNISETLRERALVLGDGCKDYKSTIAPSP